MLLGPFRLQVGVTLSASALHQLELQSVKLMETCNFLSALTWEDSQFTSQLKQAEQANGKELGIQEIGAALGTLRNAFQQLLQLGALSCRLQV